MKKPHTIDFREIDGAHAWGPLEKVRYVLETERDLLDAEINSGLDETEEAHAVGQFEGLQWALDILNHEFGPQGPGKE